MNQEQFKTLVKGMKAVYPQPTFIPDNDAMLVWYNLLKDLSYEQVSVAIQKHMMQNKFPPTIADIREKASELIKEETDELSETEAWSIVWKAICKSSYNSEEEYAKLPDDIKKVVGSHGQLRSWAIDENFNQAVESSNFKRDYRNYMQQKREKSKLPERFNNLRLNEKETEKIGEINNADRN